MVVIVRICTALNAIAVVVWLMLLLERTAWGRSPVSDYGSAMGLVALFFIVPIGGAGAWWLRRRKPEPLSVWTRRYLRTSAVFLGLTWVVSCVPTVFWSGLLIVGASHHWPLNIREGPDTAFAKERFQEHFGFPPTGVGGLYCQRGWEFGDGNTYRMTFHFEDPAILEKVVRAAGLDPMQEGELAASWVVESGPPHWWPGPGFSGYDLVFRRHAQPRLWVNGATQVAYYRSWP